jgi:hypothetical protein
MRYYVYALIDPTNDNKHFYIGKGVENRVKSHFKEAMSTLEIDIAEVDISDIAENELEEYNSAKEESAKIGKLKELFKLGYGYNDIARILAKSLEEPTALTLEAFLIKSVYGLKNLSNIVEGEHSDRFRAYNNWDCIEGFDLIKSSNSCMKQSRIDKLEAMLGEKLDEPLLEIQKAFSEFVVAPATANIIGKIANGIADDIISTCIIATKAPVLLVPAMNTAMFENSIVQSNIEKLKTFGYKFMEPEKGTMAMKGEKDRIGRLPEPLNIVNHILEMIF